MALPPSSKVADLSHLKQSLGIISGLLGPLLYVYVFLNPGPHVHFKHAYCRLTITKYFEDGLELLSTRIVGVCMYKCIRSFFFGGCSYWGLYLELLFLLEKCSTTEYLLFTIAFSCINVLTVLRVYVYEFLPVMACLE